MQDKENNYNQLVKEEIKEQIRELRKMMYPSSELSALAKHYILNRTEPFIKGILC